MAQDFDIRAALGVAETEPPAPPPPPLSMDFKAIDREGPLKPQYGSQAKLPEPFDIRKAATMPPRLEGGERVKQDIRSAIVGLGEGIAGTVATGARALMGTAGIPVPLTKGEGAVKAEATQLVHEGAMTPFEAVAPAAPTKPYTPRQFEEGVFSAGGSSITFLGPGAVARAAGLGMKGLQLLAGTLGASQSFGQRYVEAWKESGDEDKAFAAGLVSAAGGATEAFGGEALALGRLMGVTNRATKGALAVILESSAENAGQEAVQQVVDNMARMVYDGDAKLLDGVVQAAAIGGTIGSLFGAVAASVERMRSGKPSAEMAPTTFESSQALHTPEERAAGQPKSIAQLVTPLETAPLDPESVGHMDAIRADPKMAALPQAEKLVQVKPTLPEQVWAQEWLNQRGMKAVFVQDADGKALPFRGTNYRDTVYMDANLPPTEIKRRVVYHEAVHSLPGPVVNDLLAVWRKVDPKGYASLEASVAAKYPTEQVGEEAAAHNAERLVDLIAEGEVDPARLQKIINANPTLWQKFVQAIRTAAEKLGLTAPDQQFPDAVQAVEYIKAFDELLKRPTVKQQWSPAQPVATTQEAATPVVESQPAPTVAQRTAEIAPNLPPSRAPEGEKMVSAMTKQERSFAPKGIGDIVEHEGRLAEVTDVSGPRGRKSRLRIRYMERLPENEFGIREDPVRYINRGDALLVSRAGVLTREEQIYAEARRRAEQEAQATPRFALPTDEQGRKRFDIPDESFYEKLVTGGANVEERVEKIERMLGRKPHEGVTYKIDTSRGLAKQDVERVQREFLLPIAKEVSAGQIPLGQSTLGDNGKPSLGDFMRYLAAQARNAHLAGNEFTDAATGKVTKFGTEASPASGADSLGQPITNSYAAAQLERAFSSDAGPQYRKIAELVREGNAWKLDRLIESGVEAYEAVHGRKDPETGKIIGGWLPAYGPYWSSFADEGSGNTSPLSTSFQVQGSQYKKAKGRTNMGGDPFQLWLRDLASVISRTRNNAVGIEVGKLLEQYPELGRILPTGETRRGLMKRLAEINTELDLMVPTDPAGDRLRIERGEITRQLEKPTLEERETSRVYKWREGGQDVHAVLADPLMAKALHGVDIAQLPVFFRWVGPYSRLFRKMAAGYNPEFALGNAPRDVGYAWSKLYLQHGAKVANGAVSRVPTAAKALYEVERGLPATPATQSYHHYIAEAKANGADVGMVSFSDVENEMNVLREDAVGTEKLENFIAVKSPEAFKRLGRIVLSFNGLVEAMTRTAVYVEMRESGHSVEESVSAYRRTTIDWAKRGIYSNTWLSFFKAFMPAGLKGTHNFVSTIRSSPAHRVAKLAAGLFAAGYAASLMSRAMSDEWEDESEWSKARRMTVKVGKYTVGLALPWGFNLFYYGGVLAADVMHGDKTAAEATADMAGAVIDTFDPLGTPPTTSETRRGADEMLKSAVIAASPQVVQPLAEIAVNKTFTGGPVYPDSPYMADHERKWRDTADWAVNFAEFLNRAGGGTKSTEGSGISSVSPAAMEHVIKGYAPGIGQLIEDAAFTGGKILTGEMSDLTWNRIPFMRKFIRETPSSASAQKYAVASRLIEDAVGRIKDFEPRGGDYGVAAYADAKRAIDEYLAQKRKELDMATDSKHRKAIEDEMKWMREQLTRRVKQATKPK